MGFTLFVVLPVLLSVTWISGVTSGQLYMQPAKKEHGFFTGDNFFITCLTADKTLDQLKWVGADGIDITATTGRIHVQPASGAQQGLELVVESVRKEDAGTYVCSDVQNSLSFELVVYKSISFGDTEKVQHSEEFKTAVIECHVKGDPTPSVNWYFNGSRLASNSKYTVDRNSLTIFNATRNDAGDYKCEAYVITPLGSQVDSVDISFQVHYVPEWISDDNDVVYAPLGTQAILTCNASANPPPKFQWLKNGEMVESDSEYTIISNGSETSLQFTVDDEEQFGPYTCRASNSYGWIENIVNLKEGVVPDPPTVKIVREDQGVVTLDLINAKEMPDGLNVTGFKVQYKLATDEWDDSQTIEFQIGEQYMLRNMSYNSQYTFRAAALNAAGYSEYSEPAEYMTHTFQVASVVADSAFSITISLYGLIFSSGFLLFSYSSLKN